MESDINNKNASLVDECFLQFLAQHGGVRITNCVKRAVADNDFPYQNVSDFYADPKEVRIKQLKKVQDLGHKTALEYCKLIDEFISQQNTPSPNIDPTSEPSRKLTTLEILSRINERELYVIQRRFALTVSKRMTLEEIAQELSVTRERVRQIESAALKKMRLAQDVWEDYLEEQKYKIVDRIFGEKIAVKDPKAINGLLGLAITIAYKKFRKYLEDNYVSFRGWWLHPTSDYEEVGRAYRELSKGLGIEESAKLPLPLAIVSSQAGFSSESLQAAIEICEELSIYRGYLVKDFIGARKRRVIHILLLFNSGVISSPCDLWEMRAEYWKAFPDDRCSGRDLMICLEQNPYHFINLRELGWMRLPGAIPSGLDVTDSVPVRSLSEEEIMDLYSAPVKGGKGLVNKVYWLFDDEGPIQLSVAADLFCKRYPEYSPASIYPILATYAIFVRFAPGIIGLQHQMLSQDSISQARAAMMNTSQIDLYILAKRSSPPSIDYPVWDGQMEYLWCKWLFDKKDEERLSHLLYYSQIEAWTTDAAERDWWQRRKERTSRAIGGPVVHANERKFVESTFLVTALATAAVEGATNWMHLNQGLGWRIETKRVELIIALLVHAGILRPEGQWFEKHTLTDWGRKLFEELHLYRWKETGTNEFISMIRSGTHGDIDLGWAEKYPLEDLWEKISDAEEAEMGLVVSAEVDDFGDLELDDVLSSVSRSHIEDVLDEFDHD
ncbi:MAG: sigma factor-like helix-turn-helix DNA-binding protein [Candidatus Thiodiazotropha sp.]